MDITREELSDKMLETLRAAEDTPLTVKEIAARMLGSGPLCQHHMKELYEVIRCLEDCGLCQSTSPRDGMACWFVERFPRVTAAELAELEARYAAEDIPS
jgi:hypothetical protein